MDAELKCKDRVKAEFKHEIEALRELWTGYNSGDEDKEQAFYEYGLAFDYVAPGTFNDQRRGYWRYQISWGGPSDEFRFYATETIKGNESYSMDFDGRYHWGQDFTGNHRSWKLNRIEYWFMDWFDGASVTMRSGANFDLLAEIFQNFDDCGSVEAEYNKAMADLEMA